MPFEILPKEYAKQSSPQQPTQGDKLDLFEQRARELGDRVFPIDRYLAQGVKSIAAVAGGTPGTIAKLANDYIASPVEEFFTGEKSTPYEQTWIGKALPTIEQAREGIESIAPNYLKPRNEGEQFFNDSVETMAALLIPGGWASRGAKLAAGGVKALNQGTKFQRLLANPYGRAAGIALGSQSAGKLVTDFTGDSDKGDVAKGVTLVGLSLLNPGGIGRLLEQHQTAATAALASGETLNARLLALKTRALKRDVLAGRTLKDVHTSEKFVLDEADKVLRNVKGNQASVESLRAAKTSLNASLEEHLFKTPSKAQRAGAKNKAKLLNGYIREAFEAHGKQNPAFWENQSAFDTAFAARAQSNLASNLMRDHLNYNPKSSLLNTAITGSGIWGASAAGVGIQGAVTGAGAYNLGKIGYQIYKSPILRKYYLGLLNAAARQDVVALNISARKLDEQLLKEEKSQGKFEILDEDYSQAQ